MNEPFYLRDGERWHPSPYTEGPYPVSQHGGPVAAVLVAQLEALAESLGAGQATMISVCQLRPAPIAPAEVSTKVVRQGRRSSYLQGEIAFGGKPTARATAVFATPLEVATLPGLARHPADPEAAQPLEFFFTIPEVGYAACMEMRRSGDGPVWVRLNRPALEGESPLVRMMAKADSAPGVALFRAGTSWRELFQGFPTLDLTVHLLRPPEGEWLGFDVKNTWHDRGLGMTEGALFDREGPLGRIAQSFVVVPHEEK